jgi:hypothetical protein
MDAHHVCRSFLIWSLLSTACASRSSAPSSTTTRIIDPNYGVEVEHESNPVFQEVDEPIDRVWIALQSAYGQLAIPVTLFDSRRFELGNPGYRARQIGKQRLSRYLDCGRGITAVPYADEYSVTIVVTTLLRAGKGNTTTMEHAVGGSAVPRDVSGNPVHCTSTGKLEEEILQYVAERLKSSKRV